MTIEAKTIDGKTVYVLGEVTRTEFKDLINPSLDMDVGYSITEKVIHNVLERQFQSNGDPAVYAWLNANIDHVTYYVSKDMLSVRSSTTKSFEWGVTFDPECSLESAFVLKWMRYAG